jgi:hypothetical protein
MKLRPWSSKRNHCEGTGGGSPPPVNLAGVYTMSLIKIRQLEERVATNGLFMGGDHRRRKLEPGEIVEIPDEMHLPDGANLLQGLWDTGLIDIVPDTVAVTRPLDYATRREAHICSPNYKPKGRNDISEMNQIRAVVEARLFESSDSQPEPVESPEKDTPKSKPELPRAAASMSAAQKRSRRGARPKAAEHGAQATT